MCCLTDQPPGRVAAALDPLRPVADEIVLAIDARVDQALLGAYAALADRLERVEYVHVERQLGWLLGLCRGEWILRIDGDEVPSLALVRRLPELLARRDVRQYAIRRTWLWPDAGHALDDPPWSADFATRLVRNDGALPADDVLPRAYVEEPLHHLALVVADERTRTEKAIRGEALSPLLVADGGGRLHETRLLPERRAPVPRTHAVETEDGAQLAGALAAPPPAPADPAPHVRVTAAVATGALGPTPLPEDAYRARIEALGPASPMAPGAGHDVLVRFSNDGTVGWPAAANRAPRIRAGVRWHDEAGRLVEDAGVGLSFGAEVRPGESSVWPVRVVAPVIAGRYELEIDLVHEGVGWFGCPLRRPVAVRFAPDPHAPRLRPSPPASGLHVIPRVLHRVWLGAMPIPGEHERYWQTLRDVHPGWRLRTWRDADVGALGLSREAGRARTAAELADLMRYEILRRQGGVYVDTDVEGRQSLDGLLGGVEAFAALELAGRVGTAVLGCVPGHPAFARAARIARQTVGLGEHAASSTGPYLMSLVLEQEPGVHIFGPERFYPYLWDEPERRHDAFPDAYLVHHWSLSWWSQP